MLKFITFVKLTEKGQLVPPDKVPAILSKVQEIVGIYGGKIENMWAMTGRYDFVSVVSYPDEPAAFKARTKIAELGTFHMESDLLFPVEAYLEAVAEKKVLVAV